MVELSGEASNQLFRTLENLNETLKGLTDLAQMCGSFSELYG